MATPATVEKYVQAMAQSFLPDKAGSLRATYQLRLTGTEGVWTVAVAGRKCTISQGETARPDTTITMSADNYLKLAAGNLNVRQAYQQGQVKVSGNLEYALKFAEIFSPWAARVPPDAPPPAQPTPPPSPEPPPQQPQPPGTPLPPAAPSLADYVRAMPAGFRPDKAGSLQTVYRFQFTDDGSTWTVQIANRTCTVSEGAAAFPAVTIQMSSGNYIQLARGQLNTTQAYQRGQVKIDGDLTLAARISDLFSPWAGAVESTVTPTPPPTQPAPAPPTPTPAPSPTPPAGAANPTLLNGSFDDYQPYVRDGEAKVWKEPQFPERYGAQWKLKLVSEGSGRLHLMDSEVFGQFTQKYFRGGGRDYHIHGRHSQVVTSRYSFDLIFMQTIAAQPGREYNFSGSLVSFYKGTSGERADGKIFKTLGIDPTGGQDHKSPSIVWGERDGKDNEWRYPQLRVKAQGSAITVFIRLENVEKDVGDTELNIVHLDNFKLES